MTVISTIKGANVFLIWSVTNPGPIFLRRSLRRGNDQVSSMADSNKDLGKLIGAHGISPIFIQRAVAISVISFLFFLGMMFGFYIRQNIGYFLLATAFLIVYLITMFSWVMQRKTELRIFE